MIKNIFKIIIYILFILIFLTGYFAKDKNDSNKINNIKNDKVKIIAHLNTTMINSGTNNDVELYVLRNTENLFIGGGPPLTITNIRGMEQLKNVKRLILYNINNTSGTPSDVINSIIIFYQLEELCISNCTLIDMDFINSFKNLKILVINDSDIKSRNLDIKKLNNLQQLSIYRTDFDRGKKMEFFLSSVIKYLLLRSESTIQIKLSKEKILNIINIYLGDKTQLTDENNNILNNEKKIEVMADNEIINYFPKGYSLDDISKKMESYEKIGE